MDHSDIKISAEKWAHYESISARAEESIPKTEVLTADGEIAKWPETICFGKYEMETWHTAPYPSEYAHTKTLYICEFCLKYMRTLKQLKKHAKKCTLFHPPGNEIYRKGDISVFEVDGSISGIYCKNLCLLAMLYLHHKTLYDDVEPFLFYIVTKNDNKGCHFVGYFSKEKYSAKMFNLSCIVTLPCYHKQGFGRFLIDFSYLLTRREKLYGTPERPLSDLGRVSYAAYWKSALLEYLRKRIKVEKNMQFLLAEVSLDTGIEPHDITDCLQALGMFVKKEGGGLEFLYKDTLVEAHWRRAKANKERIWLDEKALKWSPTVFTPPVGVVGEDDAGAATDPPARADSPTPSHADSTATGVSQTDVPTDASGRKINGSSQAMACAAGAAAAAAAAPAASRAATPKTPAQPVRASSRLSQKASARKEAVAAAAAAPPVSRSARLQQRAAAAAATAAASAAAAELAADQDALPDPPPTESSASTETMPMNHAPEDADLSMKTDDGARENEVKEQSRGASPLAGMALDWDGEAESDPERTMSMRMEQLMIGDEGDDQPASSASSSSEQPPSLEMMLPIEQHSSQPPETPKSRGSLLSAAEVAAAAAAALTPSLLARRSQVPRRAAAAAATLRMSAQQQQAAMVGVGKAGDKSGASAAAAAAGGGDGARSTDDSEVDTPPCLSPQYARAGEFDDVFGDSRASSNASAAPELAASNEMDDKAEDATVRDEAMKEKADDVDEKMEEWSAEF